MAVNFNNVTFVKSVTDSKYFIRDKMPQFAFAGKSNVGKSSVLNQLFNRKNFARVGSTPGKTQQINYFKVDNSLYCVDLPGYGYAKVSTDCKESWSSLMESYFQEDGLITAGVLIVDSRHKPTQDDKIMLQFLKEKEISFFVLANKIDKLKNREIEEKLLTIKTEFDINDELVIPFSAEKGIGKNEVIHTMLQCLR